MTIEIADFIGEVPPHKFLLFIFAIITTLFLGNIARMLIARFLKKKMKSHHYKALSRMSMYLIYLVGFYLAFQKILNFSIPAFLAALGILGITLLLTMLPVLQNIFSGIVISVERPFRENDIVEINGVVALVKDIMLRKTILRSLEGKIISAKHNLYDWQCCKLQQGRVYTGRFAA